MAARPAGLRQDKRFAMRLPQDLYEKIEAMAQREADRRQEFVSAASVMRKLLREAVDARERKGL